MDATNIPKPLDLVVQAAGIATIYNAEDWQRVTRTPAANSAYMGDVAANDPASPH